MGPIVGAALVSAASSLLGGLFGRNDAKKANAANQAAIAAQNEYNKPINIRARAEEGGFNPLLFAGPGVGLQTGIAEYVPSGMGNAIANAGLALASGISDEATLDAYNSKLAEQNAELRKALETATLRPEVAGIYGNARTGRVADDVAQVRGFFGPDPGETPVEHKWVKIWDAQTKRYTWYPNPDLMDSGPTEMATGMATIGAAEGAQHGKPGGFDFMVKKPAPASTLSRKGPWVSFKKEGADNGSIPRITVGQ